MFGKRKAEQERLATEAKEKRKASRTVNDKLRTQIKDLQNAAEDQIDENKTLKRQQERTLAEKQHELDMLRDRVEILEKYEAEAKDLQVDRLDIESKEKLLEAKQAQFATFDKELKLAKTNGETLGEERYKTGYSDGLADGLRKIHEITAEDRKQAMQVAALAASSHTPDAASKVADGIRNNMMLGTGSDTAEATNE